MLIEELKSNPQFKIKLLLLLFRLASKRYESTLHRYLLLPVHIIYHLYSNFILNIEIPIGTQIGSPFIIWHGSGLIINRNSKLGKGIVVRNGVVIGNDGHNDSCPVILDGCSFGANSVVTGNITIGKNTKIGPCSFVNFNVDDNSKVISCTITK